MEQINTDTQLLQPWHKPEVMEMEIEATMKYGGTGGDMASQSSAA